MCPVEMFTQRPADRVRQATSPTAHYVQCSGRIRPSATRRTVAYVSAQGLPTCFTKKSPLRLRGRDCWRCIVKRRVRTVIWLSAIVSARRVNATPLSSICCAFAAQRSCGMTSCIQHARSWCESLQEIHNKLYKQLTQYRKPTKKIHDTSNCSTACYLTSPQQIEIVEFGLKFVRSICAAICCTQTDARTSPLLHTHLQKLLPHLLLFAMATTVLLLASSLSFYRASA